MEWLQSLLSKEIIMLFLAVIAMLGIFIFAARRAHLNHLKRMKEINKTFSRTDNSLS